MSAEIEVRSLEKIFKMGDQVVRALDGVDLIIPAHSFTVIMGPSGSGKSTLLYLVGGLDKPTKGEVLVNGKPVDFTNDINLALYRRKTVGFIFQSFNLVSTMTALENVSFPMWFAGTSRAKRRQRATSLLEQVGLANRAKHKPTELSGGQQQRVAFARAMVNDPPLILADEPTGNLDTTSGQRIMRMLHEYYQQGKTVVVVSHDERMKQFATHVIYLLDGKIVTEQEFQNASSFALLDDEMEEGEQP
ncbi:MAG: ABC transporter ATP-binding protein [Anaerolineae bacterium]|nr:ABC transporter ATP-binding protein [Anaerolineae bacterium]